MTQFGHRSREDLEHNIISKSSREHELAVNWGIMQTLLEVEEHSVKSVNEAVYMYQLRGMKCRQKNAWKRSCYYGIEVNAFGRRSLSI